MTLWHASGTEVPTELLAALSGVKAKPDGVRIKVVCDPFMALASLCRVRSDERGRGDGTGPAGPTSARLVMVYPELLTDAAELCTAADTYAPGVPRWQYGPATNPTLRPIVEEDVAKWTSRQSPAVVVTAAAAESAAFARSSRTQEVPGPQLRLAGEGPLPGLSGSAAGEGGMLDNPHEPVDGERLAGGPAAAAAPRSAPLITDEELRMLLGEHTDEGAAER